MTNILSTCLWFDGKAKEAADFYCSIFEGSKIISENELTVAFEIGESKFLGLNGGPMFKINPSISFFATCNSIEETDAKWAALSDGGLIMMPLDSYPWSERYGFCQDKYGVSWQVMKGDIGGQKIVTALMFTDKNAGESEEAMNFYTSVFRDSKIRSISRYEKGEPDIEGTVKHGQFSLGGKYFVAMDSSAAHEFSFNEGVSIVVNCENQGEIDYYWGKFTAEGEESMCGWLKDKWGVSWQIVPSNIGELLGDPDRALRITPIMMQMKKLDISALESA